MISFACDAIRQNKNHKAYFLLNFPVKSILWRVDVTEATVIPKELADDNNNGVPYQKRQQIRAVSHG